MVRASLLLLSFFGTNIVFSYAQDPDMPDFRSKRESITKMMEKDIQGDLATFTMAGIDLFAGQPKLKSLPVTAYDNNQITSEEEGLKVQVTAGRFDPSKHKLNYSEKYLVKIDNKPYFGGYGTVPKTTIASITVVLGADSIAIPPAAYVDLYNPDFTYTDRNGKLNAYCTVYRSADKRKIYIYLLKREDGGSYEVTWVIQDKKYLRRVVDFGFLKQ
jgi:hypothetical protein